jgi:spore coat polysaccharide biosynthesis predicted glycosyltransferase SpsG
MGERGDTMRHILYRADGSAEIGTGHLVRGLLLARACRPEARFTFIFRDDPWAISRIDEAGHPYLSLPADQDADGELVALKEFVAEWGADAAVVDLLDTGDSPNLCGALRGMRVPVLTLDNTGPGRLGADEIVNVLVREPDREAARSRGVRVYEGPEYATLLPEYDGVNRVAKRIAPQATKLLISVGGGDAAGLALKAVRALGRLASPPAATVVVGSAFPHGEALERLAGKSSVSVMVRHSLPSLLPEFQSADMAIVAGGLTMHEALATGTPALALCQKIWHQRFLAEWFEERGAMVSLGDGESAEEGEIAAAIEALVADAGRRAAMSRAGQELVDGGGTRRVAERVIALARQD